MTSTPEMLTCEWCGKDFPATPEAFVEAGFDAIHPPEDCDEWKGEESVSVDPDSVSQDQREEMKAAMGLTDDQLGELLRTGRVEGLHSIVCLKCQDECEP